DLSQGLDDRGKVHLPFAEHQVLVDAGSHVFDVDVDDFASPASDVIRDRCLSQAVQMADVERKLQVGCVHSLLQLAEAVHGVDEHSRLRLKANDDAALLSEIDDVSERAGQPI